MHFSDRTAWQPGMNPFAEAVERMRAGDQDLVDLTKSNPSACGLGPQATSVLEPLSAPGALRYLPEPFGMPDSRAAVSRYYSDHGTVPPLEHICLTTSTSEAYSFLFRLLCNPGDEVLIARPSYPLFDLLATLDDVVLREYPLFYEPGIVGNGTGGWSIDLFALEAAITERTRAIIVVHPNNPTGHYTSETERHALVRLCATRGLALIVDEVFLDYALDSRVGNVNRSFVDVRECLCFVLSGLSKICALPQVKASWIVTCGPDQLAGEALRRLEIIADTFLSMNAPVQFALQRWLPERHSTQDAVRRRLLTNLHLLEDRLKGSLGERLSLQGGWTAVLRVPRHVATEPFAFVALSAGVLVQPGELYGLPEGRCVISLLTEPETWAQGLKRLPL